MTIRRDGAPRPGLDVLLDVDGQGLVVDPKGGHWVRFVVTRVPVSPGKPHGLDDSLTLHGPDSERLVGFDNAHPARRTKGLVHVYRHGIKKRGAADSYGRIGRKLCPVWVSTFCS